MTGANPFTNRWAALGLVVVTMLGVAELVGSDGDGMLSQAANYSGDGQAAVEDTAAVAQPVVEPAPPVLEQEEEADDFALEEDGMSSDNEGVIEVIDDPADDDGGMPVLVTPEQAEETNDEQ